jgi:branched-chain amino acid transport system substrate-binding protein
VPVVVVVAPAREAARLVKSLRSAGFDGAILGGATLGRRPFIEEAGGDGEGVVFPLLFDPQRAPSAFTARYRERFGVEPDWLAAHAYDAVRLIAAAVHEAGLNRVRIQDALRAIVPWDGVTGRIAWDPTGRCVREIGLGTFRAGRVVPVEE